MRKIVFKYFIWVIVLTVSVSCVTGGFNQNPQLDELNDAIAFSPKVTSLTVNGTEVSRNTQSLYQVDAKIGDVLDIKATFDAGQGAQLSMLQFEQTYFSTEIEEYNWIFFTPGSPEDIASAYTFGPVDPGTDGIYDIDDAYIPISGATDTFEYSYTVTPTDTFGPYYLVVPGDFITLHFRISNSLDNYGYHPIQIHVVE